MGVGVSVGVSFRVRVSAGVSSSVSLEGFDVLENEVSYRGYNNINIFNY